LLRKAARICRRIVGTKLDQNLGKGGKRIILVIPISLMRKKQAVPSASGGAEAKVADSCFGIGLTVNIPGAIRFAP
jgi:hypothetical protein